MPIKENIKRILGIGDSPHRIALSFAVGVFFAISPLVGLHTILGLAVAWRFRLNKAVVLSGVYVTNPWSIVPIYTFCTWLGTVMLRFDRVMPEVAWADLTLGSAASELGHLVMPFVVGSSAVSLVASGLSYFFVRQAVEKYQSRSK
jgi:uncharacterized protein (DUF2062 family)